MIEILVVNDRAIHRSGLKRLFADELDICVIDEAASCFEALDKIRKRTFDLVLVDVNGEEPNGFSLIESVRAEFSSPAMLMLSMSPEERHARIALRAGADGYISKDIESSELIRAVRQVAAGERYVAVRAENDSIERADNMDGRAPPHQHLSARERQIMAMIVKGMSLTEIGEKLFLSVKTISTYRTRILSKIGVANNAELVLYAVRQGMLK